MKVFEVEALVGTDLVAEPETIKQALKMARRTLSILEEKAAGYTTLDMPAYLRIELEDKRKEVADLESRLKKKTK